MSREAVESLASGKSVDASTEVPAPISGVVTERLVNMGLNVDPATKLFTVVDLSTVWIVANLYEKDFARVRVGDHATVVTPAYPDRQIQGRVSYIDPQVSPESRTTKVRVEVSNPHYDLRLGMTVRSSPVRSFLTPTVAPGTTAPDGSSTTPVKRASACANAAAGSKRPIASTNATDAFKVFIRSETPLRICLCL